jgi:hypothetical protein
MHEHKVWLWLDNFTMYSCQVEVRGAVLLVMEVSRLLGLEDCEMANKEQLHLLRLLTPITKLYTAKQVLLLILHWFAWFPFQIQIQLGMKGHKFTIPII